MNELMTWLWLLRNTFVSTRFVSTTAHEKKKQQNLLFLYNLILCWMRVSVISFVCFNEKCILWFASPVKFMKRESFILHIALYRHTFGCMCVCASAAAVQRRNKYIFHATKHRRIELTVPRMNNSEKTEKKTKKKNWCTFSVCLMRLLRRWHANLLHRYCSVYSRKCVDDSARAATWKRESEFDAS